ncbi:glycosyltransferase family 4 protein [Spirosoma knui]
MGFMKKLRILHISTAHPPQDPRIVFKQCQTLAAEYEVFCALPRADSAIAPDIRFIRLPYFRLVIWRILITCPLVLLRGLWLRPKLIHVYVPEFIPFAFVFHLFGIPVIYEVQENLYKKLHVRTQNRGYWLEKAFRWFDRAAQQHFFLIFTEHGYLDTYCDLEKPYSIIYNYPLLSFIEPFRKPYKPDPHHPSFFYIGWLTFERAFDTLVSALVLLRLVHPQFIVHLFGRRNFSDKDLEGVAQYDTLRSQLQFHGYADQRDAFPYAAGATAGLALLKPVGDYPDSYTTKLFEYMALGLPVITSDFPLYKDVIERHNCGFCVSPENPSQIADALSYLIDYPEEAYAMGQRGRQAVEREYNWTSEARKLQNFYALALTDSAKTLKCD